MKKLQGNSSLCRKLIGYRCSGHEDFRAAIKNPIQSIIENIFTDKAAFVKYYFNPAGAQALIGFHPAVSLLCPSGKS